MKHLIFLVITNAISIYLAQSIPGKPVIASLVLAVVSLLIFIFREKLLVLGPRIEPRFGRMAMIAYAYGFAGAYIIVWATVKIVTLAFPGCQPNC